MGDGVSKATPLSESRQKSKRGASGLQVHDVRREERRGRERSVILASGESNCSEEREKESRTLTSEVITEPHERGGKLRVSGAGNVERDVLALMRENESSNSVEDKCEEADERSILFKATNEYIGNTRGCV
jgi:hypothetical protein